VQNYLAYFAEPDKNLVSAAKRAYEINSIGLYYAAKMEFNYFF
jgi:hypothetical protein